MADIVREHAPNAIFVPPFGHPDIMAGQGTVSLELFEQVGS